MSEQQSPVVSIAALELEHWSQGTLYESRDTSFGARLGLKDLGIGYGEVPPGKSGCPFHNHHVEDELFVILEGHGTYRFGTERYLVGPGDVLGAPAGGTETAHQIINTGTVPLKYLSISSMAATEICEYPDSGKLLAKTRVATGGRTEYSAMRRMGEEIDYWEGEPGA